MITYFCNLSSGCLEDVLVCRGNYYAGYMDKAAFYCSGAAMKVMKCRTLWDQCKCIYNFKASLSINLA